MRRFEGMGLFGVGRGLQYLSSSDAYAYYIRYIHYIHMCNLGNDLICRC